MNQLLTLITAACQKAYHVIGVMFVIGALALMNHYHWLSVSDGMFYTLFGVLLGYLSPFGNLPKGPTAAAVPLLICCLALGSGCNDTFYGAPLVKTTITVSSNTVNATSNNVPVTP